MGEASTDKPTLKRIDFEIIREDYNLYKTPDGNIIKIKLVLLDVFEQLNTKDPITGLPNYTVRSSNVVSVVRAE